MRHPPRLDSASGKTLMHFPCFDLCLTTWGEYETMFHGTVVGAAILDFFATSFFLDVDDLEVDAFLFSIVKIISLTGNDLRGWSAGRGLLPGLVWSWDCWWVRLLLWLRANAGLVQHAGLVLATRDGCYAAALVARGCWVGQLLESRAAEMELVARLLLALEKASTVRSCWWRWCCRMAGMLLKENKFLWIRNFVNSEIVFIN